MSLKPIISTLMLHVYASSIVGDVTEKDIALWKCQTLLVALFLCVLLQIKVLLSLY